MWVLLAKRYWKFGALILALGTLVGAYVYHGKQMYSQGYTAATERMQKELAEAKRKYDRQADAAQAAYEKAKAQRDKQEKVQYVEVQKIVEKPVYLHDCVDDDGVQQINRAISNK